MVIRTKAVAADHWRWKVEHSPTRNPRSRRIGGGGAIPESGRVVRVGLDDTAARLGVPVEEVDRVHGLAGTARAGRSCRAG
jgi:hypothetical protein